MILMSVMLIGSFTVGVNALDKTAFVEYAKKYANTRNNAYYDHGGSDCTNFASQALVAGGIKNVNSWYKLEYKSS